MQAQPSWQSSPCPRWCSRDHEEGDSDGDRDHQSEAVYLPVIRLTRGFPHGQPPFRELVADYVVVGTFQAQNDSRPIITVGLLEDGRVNLELRDESAERLAEALRRVLEQVRP